MDGKVKFKDFSFAVKAALNDTTIAWLYETANEITAQAQRNCAMEDDAGKQLKGSYANTVEESEGIASIGTPLEAGYWEEFGTGEYADSAKNGGKKGRQGWWVYVKGQAPRATKSQTYHSREEAEAVAASMRSEGLDAYATNGRKPNYTLEKAFEATKEPAIARLKEQLKERMET